MRNVDTSDILRYHRYKGSRGRSMWQPQQRAISAKIDNDIDAEVMKEMSASGIKRNTLINISLRWYLAELDEARRRSAEGYCSTKYILSVDTKDFTGGELEKLRYICSGFGCSEEHFVANLLHMALKDYDNNPIRYML